MYCDPLRCVPCGYPSMQVNWPQELTQIYLQGRNT
ncbi:hypothetical protein M2123_002296 [Polynucleobacter sphagniphilus]|nr:hypothetical protein [Polynucleobacter sphagniphilus]